MPEDVFVFLFVFDFLSYAARKNPLGAVRAFRQAFGRRTSEPSSCSKCANSELRAPTRSRLCRRKSPGRRCG